MQVKNPNPPNQPKKCNTLGINLNYIYSYMIPIGSGETQSCSGSLQLWNGCSGVALCLTYTPAVTQGSCISGLYETGGLLRLLLVTSMPVAHSPVEMNGNCESSVETPICFCTGGNSKTPATSWVLYEYSSWKDGCKGRFWYILCYSSTAA